MDVKKLKIYQKLADKKAIKVVAAGASETQRFDVGMHWFDYVELGFKNVYGGSCGQFINSGVTNNTSGDLLARFDNQVAVYCPDLVILTTGVNDCLQKLTQKEYQENLLKLHSQLTELGAEVVFQTYYACDLKILQERESYLADNLASYMQTIRKVAAELKSPLLDQNERWTLLRERNLVEYRTLMRDAFHVNASGNMLMGLEAMRFFDNQLRFDQIEYCRDGLILQYKLDVLARKVMDFEGRVIQ